MSTYLLIHILVISIPLLLSFDKKVHYYKRFKYLFLSIIITAIPFIAWDIAFTHYGIWGFNSVHLNGLNVFNLPLEECLFFLVVPYASLFLYDVVKAYLRGMIKYNFFTKHFFLFLSIFLLAIAAINYSRAYTFFNFTLGAMVLSYFVKFLRNKLAFAFLAYLLVLVPFLIVNGILTGYGLSEPVVWYNNTENLGIRFITIPIEDFIYALNLIFINILLYEHFQKIAKRKRVFTESFN